MSCDHDHALRAAGVLIHVLFLSSLKFDGLLLPPGVVPANFSEISFSSPAQRAMGFKISSAAWGTSGIAGTSDDFFHLSTGAQAWSLLCVHDPVQNRQTGNQARMSWNGQCRSHFKVSICLSISFHSSNIRLTSSFCCLVPSKTYSRPEPPLPVSKQSSLFCSLVVCVHKIINASVITAKDDLTS